MAILMGSHIWAVGCFAAPIFTQKTYHRLTAKLDAGDTHD